MGAEEAELAGDCGGAPTCFQWVLGRLGIEHGLEVAIAESLEQELALAHRLQQACVGAAERIEPAGAPTMVGRWLTERVDQLR